MSDYDDELEAASAAFGCTVEEAKGIVEGKKGIYLNPQELLALYQLFMSIGYISYNSEEQHAIVNRIIEIVDRDEKLAR